MSKPALTPEEWETWRAYGYVQRDGQMILHSKGLGMRGTQRISVLVAPMDTETHACAAVCLDSRPEGFTQEDVQVLRQLPALLHGAGMGGKTIGEGHENLRAFIRNLADRIQALLPPETP